MSVTGVNQLLKYTETSKMAMHQKAMRTLLGNESGHIQVSAEDEFTDTEIRYPDGETL